MLEYAYDFSGVEVPVVQDFDIADATAIKRGEAVRFTDGYIVAGGTDYTTPYAGVAAYEKVANDGQLKMRVYCSPMAVFKVPAIVTVVSATPSETDWLDSVVLLNTTADIANGGKLKIKSLASAHTGTFPVGKIVPITDSSTNHLIGAAGSFPGSTTVGDSAYFFPPIGKLGVTLSANNGLTLTWAATSGTAIKVVGHDLENNFVFVMFALHQFGNKAS